MRLLAAFLAFMCCQIVVARPPDERIEMPEITIEGTLKGGGLNTGPKGHGRGGDHEAGAVAKKKEAEDLALKQETARRAAVAAAKTEESARQKEGRDAAHELLLRLGDEPLQNDSYVIEKAIDYLTDKFLGSFSTILKTLTPAIGEQSLFDKATSPHEMKGVRYLLEKEESDYEAAENAQRENFQKLGLPVPPLEPQIEPTPHEEKLYKALRGIASLKSQDAAVVVDHIVRRARVGGSHRPIKAESERAILKALVPLTPSNSCTLPSKGWACPMPGGTIGALCTCPGLGFGKEARRPNSEFCKGVTSNCRMPYSLPLGTPCNCMSDFSTGGPVRWGQVSRPRRMR